MGIANKHPALVGIPRISAEDSRNIAEAILVAKGIKDKKKRTAHRRGNLRILPKPFKARGKIQGLQDFFGKSEISTLCQVFTDGDNIDSSSYLWDAKLVGREYGPLEIIAKFIYSFLND